MKRGVKRLVGSCLALLLVMETGNIHTVRAQTSSTGGAADAPDYTTYTEESAGLERPVSEIVLTDGAAASDKTQLLESFEGKNQVFFLSGEGAAVTFTANVERAGRYALEVQYNTASEAENAPDMYMNIDVDGNRPSQAMSEIPLDRPWVSAGEAFKTDSRGNDLQAEQEPMQGWLEQPLREPQGLTNDPLLFALTAGVHTFTLQVTQGSFYLAGLRLYNEEPLPSYEEVLQEYRDKGYQNAQGEPLQVEAERYVSKSDSSILPSYDKSNAATSPNDPAKLKFNLIPGQKYQDPGQWIEWEMDVPQSGLYAIRLRVRQNFKTGFSSTRRLYIDGEVPFAECDALPFRSSSGWEIETLGGDEDPYLFYLEEGLHTLRLEVVPGVMGGISSELDAAIFRLNDLYRGVVMVAGTTPDKYRDYQLKEEIPGLETELQELTTLLTDMEKRILSLNEVSGGELGSLRTLINLLELIREDPDLLAKKLATFKSNIESLSAWNLNLKTQPLDLDYIWLASPEAEAPRADAGFFEGLVFGAKRLLASFVNDYSSVGDFDASTEPLKVWMTLGRDQLQVLQELVNEEFSPQQSIPVELSLVSTGIREAVLAGKAPDAALFVTSDEPVNLGIRGAAVDLNTMEGFDEILERFAPNATVPFTLNGHCYGIPLTETFNMLFVRNDILKELGIEAPQTWEEMYNAAAILQRNNMEIGIPSTAGMYATLLFQNGADFYTEDLTAVTFDSAEGVAAFNTWTGFFSQYGFPLTFDFYNRFRSGEMPIGIAAYTTYTMLQTAAPEISGLWSMLPLPGTRQEDGSIDRSTGISQSVGVGQTPGLDQTMQAGMIFSTSRMQDEAFRFLDWFTSAQVQQRFGNMLEANMGPLGRYATANLEAFAALPWRAEQREQLLEQWESVRLVPEIPGSYYVARELNNAFRQVVNNNEDPVEAINRYSERMNKEIARKRMEFGLDAESR